MRRQRVIEFFRAREEKLFILVKQEIPHILIQIRDQNPSIQIISNSASVHSLSDQIPQTPPRYHLVLVVKSLLQIKSQQSETDPEITFVEIVIHVPADFPVFPPVQNDTMEETHDPNQRFKSIMRTFL